MYLQVRIYCSFRHVEGFIMIKYFISLQFWQILLLEVRFEQDWFRISKMENNFHYVQHRPGIEPGSHRWQAEILPQRYIPSAQVGHEWY